MKSKAVPLIVFLVLVMSLPAMAIESRDLDDYAASPIALAWRVEDTIYVAIVNEFSSRDLYRIEIYDTQRRSALASREVIVPDKSILIESFESRDLKYTPFPIEAVTIYRGYYGRAIKIQDQSMFSVQDYLVPANTSFPVEVDLYGIQRTTPSGRIIVDDDFRMYYGRTGGRIAVTYEPGIDYYHSNIIEYRPPKLTLTMRAPYIRDVDLLSFEIRHRPTGSWREEVVQGPVFIVYGRDYKVLDNTKGGRTSSSPSSSSGEWVTR